MRKEGRTAGLPKTPTWSAACRTGLYTTGTPPVVVRGTAVTAGVAATVAERILTPRLDNARRW
ncbi:hypothetical protein FHR32_003163 [Streptosporangium album]|uniref:Uncharacterized protein n=1 Tax=Streptosporangium album TaxID=47479 RepID=A0A7W7RWH4_9ACTN|nr:hypothetical protein [Streptosporangium album]